MASKVTVTVSLVDLFSTGASRIANAIKAFEDRLVAAAQRVPVLGQAITAMTRSVTLFTRVAADLRKALDILADTRVGRAITAIGTALTASVRVSLNALSSLSSAVLNVRTLLLGLGAAFVGSRIVSSFTRTAAELSRITDNARRLGLATTEIARLEFAARLAGVEISSLTVAVSTFNRVIGRVRQGFQSTQTQTILDSIGITREDIDTGKSFIDLFPKIAEGLNKLSEADRAFAAQALFGRAALDVLSLFEGDSSKLLANLEQVRRLVPSERSIQIGDKLDDTIVSLGLAFQRLRSSIIEALGPAVISLLERFINKIVALSDTLTPLLRGIALVIADPRLRFFADDNRGIIAALKSDTLQGAEGPDLTTAAGQVLKTRAIEISPYRKALTDLFDQLTRLAANLIARLVTFLIQLLVRLIPTIFNVLRVALAPQFAKLFAFIAEQVRGSTLDSLLGIADLAQGIANSLSGSDVEGALDGFKKALADNIASFGAPVGELVTGIGVDFAEFADNAAPAIEKLKELGAAAIETEKALDGVSETTKKATDNTLTFWKALDQGRLDFINQVGTAFDQVRRAVVDITNAIANNLTTAIVDFGAGAKDAGQAFADFARDVLRNIAEIIVQMIVLNTISQLFGGGGGSLFGFVVGAQGFAHGGLVRGPWSPQGVDRIPAMLRAREFVQPEASVRHYGVDVMEALRRRLIPRDLLMGFTGGRHLAPPVGSHLASGGMPGGGAAGVTVAIVPTDPVSMDRLTSAQRTALRRFIIDNKDVVKTAARS